MKKEPKILVVDDQPINVKLLERKLERVGMKVISALNGRTGLEQAQEHCPDVILLDVMMPDMDGFEVCRLLKQNIRTKDIPIIFITAKSSKEGKIEGLGVGAADYITKPIDLDETIARINTQLRIQENYRQNLELTSRLAETRRQAAIAHVSEGIAHNLNNLLGVVVGYLHLLKTSTDKPERFERSRKQLDLAIQRMIGIVQQLTTVAEFEQVRKRPYALDLLLEGTLERFASEHPQVTAVSMHNSLPNLVLETNQEFFEDVIIRLLINAWESYGRLEIKPEDRPIQIIVDQVEEDGVNLLRLRIFDEGCGIPSDIRENIFDPFVTTESAVGRGMGLTIAHHSVQSLGGKVTLEDNPKGGTVAVLLHPLD